MGTNECSQSASKSSWDSQDFGDVNMVLKMVDFLIGHYTYRIFPPAIDIIPTLLAVVYSNGKYTH